MAEALLNENLETARYEDSKVSVFPKDELVFSKYKNAFCVYLKNEFHDDELVIHIAGKEITFDDCEFFGFGESLVKQPSFIAETATQWGNGYEWSRISQMLSALLEEGILSKSVSARVESPDGHTRRVADQNSLLEPAICTQPRTWAECESITSELTGRKIELGYLELILPVFRVAHIYLDSDGRQVGEANVFPSALRLDIDTQWRSCHYSGSRYQEERMMNSTALRVMSKHWSEMMVCIKYVRDAYFKRLNRSGDKISLGDLERLAVVVLALPTHALIRASSPVRNGDLHPVLSSVFRVTDGVRQTAHQMLFQPDDDERSYDPDTQVSVEQVYMFAERRNSFSSEHGVCAGPRMMIEQLLNVLINGRLPCEAGDITFSRPVEDELIDLSPVIDYGLRSLQAFSIVHSLWTVMTRSLDDLVSFASALPSNESQTMIAFKRRMLATSEILGDSLLNTNEKRDDRIRIYSDMYYQCSLGLRDEETFESRVRPRDSESHSIVRDMLADAIRRKLTSLNMSDFDFKLACAKTDRLVKSLMSYFSYEQAVLKAGGEIQACINKIIGRKNADQPLHAADLMAAVSMIREAGENSPNAEEQLLSTEIREIFSVDVVITSNSITSCMALPEQA